MQRGSHASGPGPRQEAARAAYAAGAWPWAEDTCAERELLSERLGRLVDGRAGRLGSRSARTLASISLFCYLVAAPVVPKQWLQIFAGREVHTLEMRRPLFAGYSRLWRRIARRFGPPWMDGYLASECLAQLSLIPMRFTDLRARLSEQVTASDASPSGVGLVASDGVTSLGAQVAAQCRGDGARGPVQQGGVGLVLVSVNDEVGSGRMAVELGVDLGVVCHISFGSNRAGMRCARRHFPDIIEAGHFEPESVDKTARVISLLPCWSQVALVGQPPEADVTTEKGYETLERF